MVLLHRGLKPTTAVAERKAPTRGLSPTSPPTRWWRPSRSFICWWGVRLASRALVNLGIVGFAIAVGWFYFSDIYSALGRSLGLIGLGILFLAGGWALEKMRRRILAGMDSSRQSPQNAQGAAR